ncbi:peptidase M6 [Vibrio sp. J1-1]|uniref:peptidase M6 n=1 Tax=Vibrio sp. J1-1 TaxID=2912251 RepID=UPI001F178809|nr:peptidase M6 [Vibrio sp. J1-1]MBR9876368.1 peptidase M6 [Vibrionaceae bacterium]MCF7480493.1 peptidase M6 [Vibrio sp. J1-1]
MNFSNKKILRTYSTPHSKNVWGYIDTIGWRKIKPSNNDSSTNMFMMLNAAKGSGKTVSGTIEDSTNQITILYF